MDGRISFKPDHGIEYPKSLVVNLLVGTFDHHEPAKGVSYHVNIKKLQAGSGGCTEEEAHAGILPEMCKPKNDKAIAGGIIVKNKDGNDKTDVAEYL